MNRRRALMLQQAQGGGGGGGLPSEYTQLSYLQSSGTQYINTLYLAKHTDKYELGLTPTTDISNWRQTYIGCGNNNYHNIISVRFGMLGSNALRGHTSFVQNQYYDLSLGQDGFFINNVADVSNIGNYDLNLNVYICAMSVGNRAVQLSSCKVHYFRIYDNDELVRNMLPAMRNSDNALGMYDTINDVFYTNAGTGTFIGGEAV